MLRPDYSVILSHPTISLCIQTPLSVPQESHLRTLAATEAAAEQTLLSAQRTTAEREEEVAQLTIALAGVSVYR